MPPSNSTSNISKPLYTMFRRLSVVISATRNCSIKSVQANLFVPVAKREFEKYSEDKVPRPLLRSKCHFWTMRRVSYWPLLVPSMPSETPEQLLASSWSRWEDLRRQLFVYMKGLDIPALPPPPPMTEAVSPHFSVVIWASCIVYTASCTSNNPSPPNAGNSRKRSSTSRDLSAAEAPPPATRVSLNASSPALYAPSHTIPSPLELSWLPDSSSSTIVSSHFLFLLVWWLLYYGRYSVS
ncbi:hypothetical protein R3P38DRAFT_2815920 [Favolaschia claudopus]|uniref:Uncharacterized protein n=1 Tax=Favolaschia claudopus TaxID=2862362 RepID=A0AAV9Z074_9AGAR